jgi:SAM-dependent methyltransferase
VSVRKQDWAQLASVAAVTGAVAALFRRRRRRALTLFGVAAAGDVLGRRWSRADPGPLPYALRWVLAVPRPAAPLLRALEPRPGERILEIGPGLGQQAVLVAKTVGRDGRVDVLDVQQGMLDATVRRAERDGVGNVVPALADASGRLPYEDASFDAAYLMSVLGEIPDRRGTLRELRRVLKPGGRLVVGEMAADPDFVPAGRLREMADAAALRLDRRFGPPFAYHARFVAR